jgi:altronate dehydratase
LGVFIVGIEEERNHQSYHHQYHHHQNRVNHYLSIRQSAAKQHSVEKSNVN